MSFLFLLLPVALLAGLAGGGSSSSDAGDDGADVQKGGAADNDLEGDGGADLLAGFGGDDTLTGAGAADLLVGDAGDDVLSGDAGDDLLLGGTGEDQLNGGLGDDLLVGGEDEDLLLGEGGDDLLVDLAGSAEMYGGAGNDTLVGLRLEDRADAEVETGLDLDGFLAAVEQQFGSQPATFERMLERNVMPVSDQGSFDRLVGGAGDDRLVGDRGDVMAGGEGADVYAVLAPTDPADESDPAFGEVVRVNDFDPAMDSIEVRWPLEEDVEITATDVEGGVLVQANGVGVMLLVGRTEADISAVRVVRLLD